MDITSYILSKKYVEDSLAGAGALAGKSAYEIAQENGFKGSASEWLASLRGDTPQIGPNGTWVISGNDTGVIASPSLAGYATEEFVNQQIANIPEVDLTPYATREELSSAILGIVIPDVSGFATKKELEAAIKAIPAPDLTSYATKQDVEDAIGAIIFPETDLTDYATKQDVSDAIDAIPEVDLEGLATEDFVREEVGKINIPDITGLATEEYVVQKIAEAELGEGEVDLSAYYTKTEVDNKIAAIEIPEPDLDAYVTDEELTEALNGIQIPSTDGLASEEYVDEAISNIAIPSVEGLASEAYVDAAVASLINSAPETLDTLGEVATALARNQDVVDALNTAIGNKADKSEIPSIAGLASEEYVNNAIANIEIPEAKADVNVYEISSDSVVLDELVALLPEGVEINQGDVMLVTNTLGVKSAYQFDGTWIACDGNVDASKVIIPFDITLAGSYT